MRGYLLYIKTDDFILFAIADGLGNGPVAEGISRYYPNILEKFKDETLDELLLRCNEQMVNKRGAAVAIVKIDYKLKTISYSCVGNVKFYMYQRSTDKMIYPLPVMGYLSGRKQKYNTQTYLMKKMICSCFIQTGL